jgi:hypothetical protein
MFEEQEDYLFTTKQVDDFSKACFEKCGYNSSQKPVRIMLDGKPVGSNSSTRIKYFTSDQANVAGAHGYDFLDHQDDQLHLVFERVDGFKWKQTYSNAVDIFEN